MSTYKELIYLVLDKLKLSSDDSYFTEEHVLSILVKYRGLLLKQKYSDIKKDIPDSNYQTVCLDLIEVPAIPDEECEGGVYLRSTKTIPHLMNIGSSKVYPVDYFQGGNITLVSMQRMRYVGYNRWMPNIIYASIGPDNHLYFKSGNPQYLYMKKVRMTGIFENPEKAIELSCDEESTCDIMDMNFPIEEALIPQLITLTEKTLSGAIYRPVDSVNDSSDNMSDIASFIKRNLKSNFQKQVEGDNE